MMANGSAATVTFCGHDFSSWPQKCALAAEDAEGDSSRACSGDGHTSVCCQAACN